MTTIETKYQTNAKVANTSAIFLLLIFTFMEPLQRGSSSIYPTYELFNGRLFSEAVIWRW